MARWIWICSNRNVDRGQGFSCHLLIAEMIPHARGIESIENEGSLRIPVFTQRGAIMVDGDICWSHQIVLLLRREFELHDVGLGRDNTGD